MTRRARRSDAVLTQKYIPSVVLSAYISNRRIRRPVCYNIQDAVLGRGQSEVQTMNPLFVFGAFLLRYFMSTEALGKFDELPSSTYTYMVT